MSRTSKGITLVELLISVMLISVMLGAMWVVYSMGSKIFYGQLSRYNIKDETSLAFTTITKELHQAFSVTDATATSITFTTDLDSDGVYEEIEYSWSGVAGSPLDRSVTIPPSTDAITRPLVCSAQSVAFTYYNTNNVLLSTPIILPSVHLVAVDVTAVKGDETFHLRTNIFLQMI